MKLKKDVTLKNGKYNYVIDTVIESTDVKTTYNAHTTSTINGIEVTKHVTIVELNREENSTPQYNEQFEMRKKEFLHDAQVLSQLNNCNSNHVMDLFEENSTAYYVKEQHPVQSDVTVEIVRHNSVQPKRSSRNNTFFSTPQLCIIGLFLILAIGVWVMPSIIDASSHNDEQIQPIEMVNDSEEIVENKQMTATPAKKISKDDFNNVNFSEETEETSNNHKQNNIPKFSMANVNIPAPTPQVQQSASELAKNDSVIESNIDNNHKDNPFQWLSEHQFSEDELIDMTPDRKTLRIWCNAIFARHGYIFKTQELTEYFSQYDWYNPISTNVETKLSDIERENARVLRKLYEEA